MKTLQEAWDWYEAIRQNAKMVHRMADKHWDHLPDDPLYYDDRDIVLQRTQIERDQLDYLAILVLFSVFEAIVRQRIADEIALERQILKHPVLIASAIDAAEGIEVGSFARVLEPYKSPETVNLIEQVNQVRRYRNWVAHGKRDSGKKPETVSPEAARQRLQEFLGVICSTNVE
jgi:hypothetical protein